MNVVDTLILGLDAGNYDVKISSELGVLKFCSAICEWFQRDIEEDFGDDLEFNIDGRRGYSGNIARYEDSFGESAIYGDSKATEDNKIKVLLGIYRYMKHYKIVANTVSLVVGQPIKGHVTKDKNIIINMLKGVHEFTVNNESVRIEIFDCGVCAEGAGSFWSIPEDVDTANVIDLGSRTCNMVSVKDKRVINIFSDTLSMGSETGRNKHDIEVLARGIIRGASRLKWNKNDLIYICGGSAEKLLAHIQSHYPNTSVLYPISHEYGNATKVSPTFSNCIGFYKIAKASFS